MIDALHGKWPGRFTLVTERPTGFVTADPEDPGPTAGEIADAVDEYEADAPARARAGMVLTRWQLRTGLRAEGKFDQAAAAVAALGDPIVSDWWDDSGQEVRRTSPAFEALALGPLGYTPEGLDTFFIAYATINL